MNAHLLIDSVVQQTVVFIAELSTAGGIRAPLAHVAGKVFADLTAELQDRGLSNKIIADMFGMALRTYHRRVREVRESRTVAGQLVWEAVLAHVRKVEPVRGMDVLQHFDRDDPAVVTGALIDLVETGLLSRAGRGDTSVYRVADAAAIGSDNDRRSATQAHLVWLCIYRHGPLDQTQIVERTGFEHAVVTEALATLLGDRRIEASEDGDARAYAATRLEIPIGAPIGWEAAVLDHYQAVVTAIIAKLSGGAARAGREDITGGSTWSLDVWPGHPLEGQAKGLLAEMRSRVEALRDQVDAHNEGTPHRGPIERVVFYAGQNVRDLEREEAR